VRPEDRIEGPARNSDRARARLKAFSGIIGGKMRKLGVFNLMTLDGYIAGPDGDISWHRADRDFQAYAEKNSNSGNTLLFGRLTYELMAGYWTSPEAIKNDPVVAAGMNNSQKIVFSRTLDKADWIHTRLVKNDMVGEVRNLKRHSERNMTILGSGSIVAQLAQAQLIDEYQIMLIPVALGKGKTMFENMAERVSLKLTSTQTFGNGNILLVYQRLD
jgi:dihydrofolate reductase